MKTAKYNNRHCLILSEFNSKAEIVFMDATVTTVNIFDLLDVRYNTTQYNDRSIDFMSLSDDEQRLFVTTHRGKREKMRADALAKRLGSKSKTKKIGKKGPKKTKIVMSPEKQIMLEKLLASGFKL